VADPNNRYSEDLRWKPGVSVSQARFALSNFCLTHFGADGQYFADVIELCADVCQLQEVLNTIRDEVRGRCPGRLPALATCVREANEDGAPPVATAIPPPSTLLIPETPERASRAPLMGNPSAGPVHAVSSHTAAVSQPVRNAATDPLRLGASVSLAQARFALSEFCLNQFGARSQQLLDAIDRCNEATALQKVLSNIGSQIRGRQDCLSKLIDCVREINATAD